MMASIHEAKRSRSCPMSCPAHAPDAARGGRPYCLESSLHLSEGKTKRFDAIPGAAKFMGGRQAEMLTNLPTSVHKLNMALA